MRAAFVLPTALLVFRYSGTPYAGAEAGGNVQFLVTPGYWFWGVITSQLLGGRSVFGALRLWHTSRCISYSGCIRRLQPPAHPLSESPKAEAQSLAENWQWTGKRRRFG